MKAMILAAGEGRRLRPYTLSLPKPAIPFLGVPLIDYGIHLLDELDHCDFVVNLHHLADDVRGLFPRPRQGTRHVDFSDETAALLGSGGGIHKAEKFLKYDDHFVAINGDEVILPHSAGQIRAAFDEHVKSGRLATLLVIENPEVGTKFGGAWASPDHRVQTFSRAPVEGLKGWHFIGLAFYSQRLFSYFKPEYVDENILYETLTLAMQKGETVAVRPIQAEWFETGNPADFKAATEACLSAMSATPTPDWAAGLKIFLRGRMTAPPLIEKDDPLIVSRLESLRKSLA